MYWEVPPTAWVNSTGASFPLTLTDSTVYFWRVSIDQPGNNDWQEFSFQYIPGQRGWGQDHFCQFKNNEFTGLNYDRTNRRLTFDPVSKTIHCQTYGNAVNNTGFFGTLWEKDGDLQDYAYCNTNAKILVGVIDPNTLETWETRALVNGAVVNPDHNFGIRTT